MSQTVAIIDYGAGNLHSVAHALRAVGASPVLVDGAEQLQRADRVVLPGVGEMGSCMEQLRQRGLDEALCQYIAAGNRPLLAVCVGLQLLAEATEEHGGATALGLIPGMVKELPAAQGGTEGQRRLKVPHIGWTQVQQRAHPCWSGIEDGCRFYFVHKYYLPSEGRDDLAGSAKHGVEFAAALSFATTFATQFHPEKSGKDGLQLYANFMGWKP